MFHPGFRSHPVSFIVNQLHRKLVWQDDVFYFDCLSCQRVRTDTLGKHIVYARPSYEQVLESVDTLTHTQHDRSDHHIRITIVFRGPSKMGGAYNKPKCMITVTEVRAPSDAQLTHKRDKVKLHPSIGVKLLRGVVLIQVHIRPNFLKYCYV